MKWFFKQLGEINIFLKNIFSQGAAAVFLVVVFRGVSAEGEEGGKGKYKVLTQEDDDKDGEMEKELSSMVDVDLGEEDEGEDEEELL